MRKLILVAALLAPTLAQAGFYERIPTDLGQHYSPTEDPMSPRYQYRREEPRDRGQTCFTQPQAGGGSVTVCNPN